MEITGDASPWGLGADLRIQGVLTAWFCSSVSALDEQILGHTIGSPDGQQVWETLTMLVALRAWKKHWAKGRVMLHVRGDSVTMLTLVLKLRPNSSSPGLILLAKEMALDIADATYSPDVASHVPGVANKGPDALSRKDAPPKEGEAVWKRPAAYTDALETTVPLRDHGWYRTLRGKCIA